MPDSRDGDPLQLHRVSMQGHAHKLIKNGTTYLQGQKTYLDKFPQADMIFQMTDFNLYALQIDKGRYVAGFSAAYDLTPELLKALSE